MSRVDAERVLTVGTELMGHFGADIDPIADPENFRNALTQLNPRFSGDRDLVRFELEGDVTAWSSADKDEIMDAATTQGLLAEETPLKGVFDHVISLGAARQANLDRPTYAMNARLSHTALFAGMTIVGSARKIGEAERENVANYAPEVTAFGGTEFDLVVAAARTVAREYPGYSIGVNYVDNPKASTENVLRSVTLDLTNNTAKPAVLKSGDRIATVTTQIYQPATALDTMRIAEQFGLDGFTAGNPSDPNIVAKRTPATYLSEVLRTTRAAHDYLVRPV